MIKEVLQINSDGTQEMVNIELPDNWDDMTLSIGQQIATLKSQLAETDYKVIKCSEASLAGVEVPYDIKTLYNERQEIRDQISNLESGVQ